MKKTFTFKKIDYYGNGRKVNLPEVEMFFGTDIEGRPALKIRGKIWNSTHTDLICGGQCLETMAQFDSLQKDPTFNKLYYLWNNYHCNDFHNGTKAQEAALKAKHIADKENSIVCLNGYDADCEYLNNINLYNDNGHVYGKSFIYWDINEDDLREINRLME